MTKQEPERKTVCALRRLLCIVGFLLKNKNPEAPEEADIRSCL